MRDDKINQMLEKAWRRPLTPAEQAQLRQRLADRPEKLKDLLREQNLTRALGQTPAPRISTNFTARVMIEVRRAPAPLTWRERVLAEWGWLRLAPRFAIAALAMTAGVVGFHEYRVQEQGNEARAAAAAGRLAALSKIEWLSNFNTIERMDKVKVADDELLSVLE